MGALAELNSKLLLPEGDAIDPAALAKLDLSFLDLDLLEDAAFAPGGAGGGDAAEFRTEQRKVASLLRAKLDQMRAFNQVAAAARSARAPSAQRAALCRGPQTERWRPPARWRSTSTATSSAPR